MTEPAHKISITHAAGRGKGYVAVITGRDEKYKWARTFLRTAENGEKYNCYVGLTTLDAVPVGAVVETATANYKGKQSRQFWHVATEGPREISEADVATYL